MNAWSVFSGIGGLDEGLRRAGFRHGLFCESDAYRRGILERHWPGVPVYEDVAAVCRESAGRSAGVGRGGSNRRGAGHEAADLSRVDLLCGGFPCQDLSVAGQRAGLAGKRSSLFFEFARIAESLRPRWLLVENVPGLLSSNGGRDFAVVLATLAELGYGVCWRVLDSRFFGVPQRRRRVFVVGHLGARSTDPFLPFLEGGEGHLEASREARQAASVASLSGLGSGGPDDNDGQGGRLIAATLKGHNGKGGSGIGPEDTFIAAGHQREDDVNLVSFDAEMSYNGTSDDAYLTRKLRRAISSSEHGVRRLTPTECCRLQGFPDDWLGEPNEPPDSPRYAALGDAVTVNVAQWIGEQIMEADKHIEARAAA